jgi:lysophospholipase L1-like esterase
VIERPRFGPGRRQAIAARLALSVVSSVLVALALDRIAGQFVPAVPTRVAHPPNLTEVRRTIDFTYEFRTNSKGLRYRELPDVKAETEFRAALAGDSFTEGYGVPAHERTTERLEAAFAGTGRQVSFINCGLSGVGPVEFGSLLLSVCAEYGLDTAVIQIFPNDVGDTGVGARLDLVRGRDGRLTAPTRSELWKASGLPKRAVQMMWPWTYGRLQFWSMNRDAEQLRSLGFVEGVRERARREGIPAARVDDWLATLPRDLVDAAENRRFNGSALALGLFEPDRWRTFLDLEGELARAKWQAMKAVLTQIVTQCQQERIICAVAYAPSIVQYDQAGAHLERATGVEIRPEWLTGASVLEQQLQAWAADVGVPFLSMTEAFRRASAGRSGALNFRFDGHWNAAGHQVAADALARWLREQRLVPSP